MKRLIDCNTHKGCVCLLKPTPPMGCKIGGIDQPMGQKDTYAKEKIRRRNRQAGRVEPKRTNLCETINGTVYNTLGRKDAHAFAAGHLVILQEPITNEVANQ